MSSADQTIRLEDLTDDELDRLEDRLLVERELDWAIRSGATAGRLVVFLLVAALFLILEGATRRLLGGVELGVLLFVAAYVLLLGAAVMGAWTIWKAIGRHGRRLMRQALHYWPLTLYVAALLAGVRLH